MLDSKGFDTWSTEYDSSVRESDEADSYPFAGYEHVHRTIFDTVKENTAVLDLGFGTALLTEKLYEKGCSIGGQDFSKEMVRTAQQKMPEAVLRNQDFREGIHPDLKRHAYDYVICTYAIHHLNDAEKIRFIQEMLSVLKENGLILIGDIAFESRKELEQCRSAYEDLWDEEEIYCVYEELKKEFPKIQFQKISFCAGLLTLTK